MEKNRVAVGIDLGGTNLRVAAVNKEGKILDLAQKKSAKSKEKLKKQIGALILKVEKEIGKAEVTGIGISVAGPINKQKGIVSLMPNIPKIKNWKIKKELQRKFKVAVELENDANAALLGERWLGLAKGKKDVLLLTLGTGVGGAALVGGRILKGRSGAAAEFGHIVVDPNGPICGCGKKGCLESFCGAEGILRMAEKEELKVKEVEDVFMLAKAKSQKVTRVLQKFSAALAIGLGNLINIFNPELIILSGKVSKSSDVFLPRTQKYLKKECFDALLKDVDIRKSEMIDQSAFLGVANLALKI